jgi:chemotaxis protein histidine kinase CheA
MGSAGSVRRCRPSSATLDECGYRTRQADPEGKATAKVITYQDVAWQIWPKQCHSLASLPPSSCHTMLACFRPNRAKKLFSHAIKLERQMDSLLSPPKDQRHKEDIAPLVPGPTAVTARLGGPLQDSDGWFAAAAMSPQPVDVSAEESCPAPSFETSARNESPPPAPDIHPPQVPSAKTSELIDQLDELASDLAARGRPSSDEVIKAAQKEPELSVESQVAEPSIRVPPRADFEGNPIVSGRLPMRRRTIATLAGVCLAALTGAGIAWQSNLVWPTASTTGADVATPKVTAAAPASGASASIAPAQTAPVAQAAATPAPPPTPELVKQLETIAQDLTVVRRSVEQLAAKQEELAAAQQQLEQLAAKQTQLAAKQEQLAQNLAKLQATEPSVKPKTTPPPQSRAAAVPPPPRTSPEPAVQLPTAPRQPSHPVPPLPIPP